MSRIARAAVRVYPPAWRARYGDEMLGTLADLAADGREPGLRELGALGLRGLWLRARRSPAFWLGVGIVVAMIVAPMVLPLQQPVDRWWTGILARAGVGFTFALPLAAPASAWIARRASSTRSLVASVALVLVPLALGYLGAVLVVTHGTGWPAAVSISPAIVLGFGVPALAALVVGVALGSAVRPAALAASLAGALTLAWFASPFVVGAQWFALTGFDTRQCCSVYAVPQPDVAVATSLVVIVLGTLATLLLRSRRQIWALVPLAMLAVLAVWTVPPTGTVTIVGRPTAEAVCAGSAPRVCLWPEQEAEDGPEMRSALATAYPKAVALGLRAQPVIAVAGYDDGESAIRVGVTGDPDAVITDLAHQLVAQWSRCQWFDGPDQPADLGLYERAQQSAAYGAAVLLGADPIAALPSVHVVTGRDWTTGPTLDAVATRNWLGVRDEADARAVVARWTSSALEARCTSPVG